MSHIWINPLTATLKPHSNGPLGLHNNTVIGTLAADGWAVTFGTAMRDLGGLQPRPVPSYPSARHRIRANASRAVPIPPSFRWYSPRLPTKGWPGWVDPGSWLERWGWLGSTAPTFVSILGSMFMFTLVTERERHGWWEQQRGTQWDRISDTVSCISLSSQ